MNKTIELNINDIVPDEVDVLHHQGIPKNVEISQTIKSIMNEAYGIFVKDAAPVAILSDISKDEFDDVFKGEGNNADDAIVKEIYPEAEYLALFALTMGEKVSSLIEDLFDQNDYALAAMLDSVASMAADKTSTILEKHYHKYLETEKSTDKDFAVLGYSPGYCGWHVSGQKKLFEYLKPSQIGITINDSSLMTPIKSVSGVLVGGDKEVHIFQMGFSYCDLCKTLSCQERMSTLY